MDGLKTVPSHNPKPKGIEGIIIGMKNSAIFAAKDIGNEGHYYTWHGVRFILKFCHFYPTTQLSAF